MHADRDAGQDITSRRSAGEKPLDRICEETRHHSRLRNVRIAVPRIVQSIKTVKRLRQVRDQLLKQIELCSQRVQQNDYRAGSGPL